MIKKTAALFLAVLLTTAFSGCAAQPNPSPAAAASASASASPSAGPGNAEAPGADGYYTFDYDGAARKYMLYIPNGMEQNAPLVCVLHGYTGTAADMIRDADMNGLADEYGFAVVCPQGLPGAYGADSFCWNADLTFTDTDDLGFLVALMGHLQKTYGLGAEQTFAAGFSNGGYMCYKLACDAPDTFRAIASVSGTMSGQTWEGRDASVAVPVLQIHGTGDDVVPLDGSKSVAGGWGGAPAISEVIKYWADADGAHGLETMNVSGKVTAYRYSSKDNDNLVWYYEIEGYPHSWPKEEDAGFNAGDVIWEFFSNYVKDEI